MTVYGSRNNVLFIFWDLINLNRVPWSLFNHKFSLCKTVVHINLYLQTSDIIGGISDTEYMNGQTILLGISKKRSFQKEKTKVKLKMEQK